MSLFRTQASSLNQRAKSLLWIALPQGACPLLVLFMSCVATQVQDDSASGSQTPQACIEASYECGLWNLEGSIEDCGLCGGAGSACDLTGQCVAQNDQGLYGEITLTRRHHLFNTEDMVEAASVDVIIAEAVPLPEDTRVTVVTADGETCTLEASPNFYPYQVDGEPWLQSPYQSAGVMSFSATDAPGPVVLEVLNLPSSGARYNESGVPESDKDANWFDWSYLPESSTVLVDAAGESPIDPFLLNMARVPRIPSDIEPQLVREVEIGDRPTVLLEEGEAVSIQWSALEGNHWFEVEYNSYTELNEVRLKCRVRDDGELLIPAEALAGYLTRGGSTTLTLRRGETRRFRVDGASPLTWRVQSVSEILGLIFTEATAN